MTGDATTSATTDTGCTPGELGCDCDGGLCLGDLECNNGICSDPNCLPGELACECDNGLCLGDLVCVGGCVSKMVGRSPPVQRGWAALVVAWDSALLEFKPVGARASAALTSSLPAIPT